MLHVTATHRKAAMENTVWISLSFKDRLLLRDALIRHAHERDADVAPIAQLLQKLEPDSPYPDITIGVYGGQVQWTLGNPFPVRICDYDGDKCDLPDLDKDGEWCRQWLEPADAKTAN